MRRGTVLLVAALVAAVLVVPISAGFDLPGLARLSAEPNQRLACDRAEKKRRQAALATYKKEMPKQRAAYFRRHKGSKQRAAFVKKQQAKLKALERAIASCSAGTAAPPPAPAPSPVADLSLTKAVRGETQAVYTLTVRNNGPRTAVGVTVSDTLPAVVSFLAANASQGACAGTRTVVCALGDLANGTAATVSISVRGLRAERITNTASVSTSTRDPVLANNTATASSTLVLPEASSGPPCSPSLARGPLVHVGHPSTYTAGETDYGIFIRPLGSVRVLMLFVDFPDAPATESTSDLVQHIVPASAEWYRETSENRVALEVAAQQKWFRMPQPSTAYALSTGAYNERYVRDAIAATDHEVDFGGSPLVYIVPSKGAAIDRGQSPYAFGPGGLQTGEGAIRHATYVGPGYREPWVLIHESLHHLGLPDLYDFDSTGGSSRHVGSWDVMSNPFGGALLGWHKWKLGWLSPGALRCLSGSGQLEETLSPVATPGGVKAVVVPTGASTAYVIEARARIGKDAVCDAGVLVYTVDATVWSGSGPIRVKGAKGGAAAEADPCRQLATYDVGLGEVPTFTDPTVGLTVEVLLVGSEGYRVRVTRG